MLVKDGPMSNAQGCKPSTALFKAKISDSNDPAHGAGICEKGVSGKGSRRKQLTGPKTIPGTWSVGDG